MFLTNNWLSNKLSGRAFKGQYSARVKLPFVNKSIVVFRTPTSFSVKYGSTEVRTYDY